MTFKKYVHIEDIYIYVYISIHVHHIFEAFLPDTHTHTPENMGVLINLILAILL